MSKTVAVPVERELLAGLVEIADQKMLRFYGTVRQGSPNHRHSIPGVWDSDNGDLAGKPCAECAIYDKARAILSAPVVNEPAPNLNTGHGYVRPRPDGVRMRCGGPSICQVCILEARTLADFGPSA